MPEHRSRNHDAARRDAVRSGNVRPPEPPRLSPARLPTNPADVLLRELGAVRCIVAVGGLLYCGRMAAAVGPFLVLEAASIRAAGEWLAVGRVLIRAERVTHAHAAPEGSPE